MSTLADAEKEVKRLQYLEKEVQQSGDITKIAHFNKAVTKVVSEHTRLKHQEFDERRTETSREDAEVSAEYLMDRSDPSKARFAPEDYMRYYYPDTYKKVLEKA